MQDWLEPLAGGIVLAITLADVFLTVLYARAGTGLIAPRLAGCVWRVFLWLGGARRPDVLSYCGPVQLVALVLTWISGLDYARVAPGLLRRRAVAQP